MRIQQKSRKRSATKARGNDYGSNDGFVVDSDAGDDTPLAKRAKTTTEGRRERTNLRQGSKPAKKKAVESADIDDDGNTFWEISNSRRVTISEFKGKRMVSIREYYEKDGKHFPGKKGISMPMDQYSKFMAIVPEVEAALKAKGEEVVRPIFESSSGGNDVDDAGNDDDNDDEEEEEEEQNDYRERKVRPKVANGGKKNGVKKDTRKKNFEATSEEDDDDVGVRENDGTDEDE